MMGPRAIHVYHPRAYIAQLKILLRCDTVKVVDPIVRRVISSFTFQIYTLTPWYHFSSFIVLLFDCFFIVVVGSTAVVVAVTDSSNHCAKIAWQRYKCARNLPHCFEAHATWKLLWNLSVLNFTRTKHRAQIHEKFCNFVSLCKTW